MRGNFRSIINKSTIRLNSTKVEIESSISTTNELNSNLNSNSVLNSKFKQLNAHNIPFDGPLDQLSEMTENEFNEIINSSSKPTLNREEILNLKFNKLLNLYGNKDKLKKQFSSSSLLLSKFPNLIPSDSSLPYTENELIIRQRHHYETMSNLGSNIKKIFKPHELILKSNKINNISIKKLMSSGAHLGRSTSLFNQNFQPFIYGNYKGLNIIDLDKTSIYLKNACKIIQGIVENGGIVLFLGVKIGQLKSIKEASKKCNGYYVSRKWIPGIITNSLENSKPRHEIDMEDFKTNRELNNDESNKIIKPDLIIILNPELSNVAIKEANQARIPTIGIIDSNVNPNLVVYPIPANSNSTRTTDLIVGVLGKAGEIGLKRRLQKVKEYKKNLGMESNECFTEIEKFEE